MCAVHDHAVSHSTCTPPSCVSLLALRNRRRGDVCPHAIPGLRPFPAVSVSRLLCSTLYPSRPPFSPSSRSRNELNPKFARSNDSTKRNRISTRIGASPSFPSPLSLFYHLSFSSLSSLSSLFSVLFSFLSFFPPPLLFFFRCPLLRPLYESESESILDPPFLSPVAATYLLLGCCLNLFAAPLASFNFSSFEQFTDQRRRLIRRSAKVESSASFSDFNESCYSLPATPFRWSREHPPPRSIDRSNENTRH